MCNLALFLALKFGIRSLIKIIFKYAIILIIFIILASCDQSTTQTEPIETDTDPIAEVTNLTAAIIQETTISLEWEDNAASEIAFEIFERSGSEGDFIPLMRTELDVTNVSLNKQRRAFDYCYKVRALNKDGASGFSNEARVVGFQLAVLCLNASTSELLASLTVSPCKRFLPASRNSLTIL